MSLTVSLFLSDVQSFMHDKNTFKMSASSYVKNRCGNPECSNMLGSCCKCPLPDFCQECEADGTFTCPHKYQPVRGLGGRWAHPLHGDWRSKVPEIKVVMTDADIKSIVPAVHAAMASIIDPSVAETLLESMAPVIAQSDAFRNQLAKSLEARPDLPLGKFDKFAIVRIRRCPDDLCTYALTVRYQPDTSEPDRCTWHHTKKNHALQYWFECTQCFPDAQGLGVCIHCAADCQDKGHVLKRRYGPFFCDKGYVLYELATKRQHYVERLQLIDRLAPNSGCE